MKYRIKLTHPKEVINYRRYYKKYKKKVKEYFIAGGQDPWFKATHIEFYGVDTNQINS